MAAAWSERVGSGVFEDEMALHHARTRCGINGREGGEERRGENEGVKVCQDTRERETGVREKREGGRREAEN